VIARPDRAVLSRHNHAPSAHLEYDLAKVVASFEVALRCARFCQGKTPIDDHLKFLCGGLGEA
jgi:hypothetical protein